MSGSQDLGSLNMMSPAMSPRVGGENKADGENAGEKMSHKARAQAQSATMDPTYDDYVVQRLQSRHAETQNNTDAKQAKCCRVVHLSRLLCHNIQQQAVLKKNGSGDWLGWW